jgi:hypothetical protein
MKRHTRLTALLVAVVAACGSDGEKTPSENVRVHGTVAQELRTPGLRALAIGADGRWISTSVATSGSFTLDLPKKQPYRLVITRGTASGGQSVVGRVVFDGEAGKTVWISGREADVLSFGTLREVGTTSTSTPIDPSKVGTLARGSGRGGYEGDDHDDSDDDHDDDSYGGESGDSSAPCGCEEHEKESYDVCSDAAEKELSPSNASAAEHCDYEQPAETKEPVCAAESPAESSAESPAESSY